MAWYGQFSKAEKEEYNEVTIKIMEELKCINQIMHKAITCHLPLDPE